MKEPWEELHDAARSIVAVTGGDPYEDQLEALARLQAALTVVLTTGQIGGQDFRNREYELRDAAFEQVKAKVLRKDEAEGGTPEEVPFGGSDPASVHRKPNREERRLYKKKYGS